jgi:hypothetical protein
MSLCLDKKKLERISGQVSSMLANTSTPDKKGSIATKLVLEEEIGFALLDDQVKTYFDLLEELSNLPEWREKVSEKFLDAKLRTLMVRAIREKTNEKISLWFQDIDREINDIRAEARVFVPLSGIALQVGDLAIGKVVLRAMTPDLAQEIENAILATSQASRNTPEEKKAHTELLRERLSQWNPVVCAEFRCVAESERAQERAFDETGRVLDFLRFCIPAIYGRDYRVQIGFYGEVARTVRIIPQFTDNPRSFSMTMTVVGPILPFEVMPSNLEHIRKIGLDTVSQLLNKSASALTDIERALLRSIHWFANAQIQGEAENRLLSTITCFEAMLTPDDNDPISNAIAEGAAIILGTNSESMKDIKKFIKLCYRKRSGVSHGGAKTVLNEELERLTILAGEFLTVMIRRKDEFGSRKDVFDWIETRKFS